MRAAGVKILMLHERMFNLWNRILLWKGFVFGSAVSCSLTVVSLSLSFHFSHSFIVSLYHAEVWAIFRAASTWAASISCQLLLLLFLLCSPLLSSSSSSCSVALLLLQQWDEYLMLLHASVGERPQAPCLSALSHSSPPSFVPQHPSLSLSLSLSAESASVPWSERIASSLVLSLPHSPSCCLSSSPSLFKMSDIILSNRNSTQLSSAYRTGWIACSGVHAV